MNVADREGNIVETWTQWDKLWDGSSGPHHIKINPYDPEKHVWIIDDDLQQILKFTNDGKQLVRTIGERLVKGNDEQPFRPADRHRMAARWHVLHYRRIHQCTRVLKFDKDGKFLMTWGKEGSGPGQFKPPVHAWRSTASGASMSPTVGTAAFRCSTRTASFSTQWPNIRDPCTCTSRRIRASGSRMGDEQVPEVRQVRPTAVLAGEPTASSRAALGRSPVLRRSGRQPVHGRGL